MWTFYCWHCLSWRNGYQSDVCSPCGDYMCYYCRVGAPADCMPEYSMSDTERSALIMGTPLDPVERHLRQRPVQLRLEVEA